MLSSIFVAVSLLAPVVDAPLSLLPTAYRGTTTDYEQPQWLKYNLEQENIQTHIKDIRSSLARTPLETAAYGDGHLGETCVGHFPDWMVYKWGTHDIQNNKQNTLSCQNRTPLEWQAHSAGSLHEMSRAPPPPPKPDPPASRESESYYNHLNTTALATVPVVQLTAWEILLAFYARPFECFVHPIYSIISRIISSVISETLWVYNGTIEMDSGYHSNLFELCKIYRGLFDPLKLIIFVAIHVVALIKLLLPLVFGELFKIIVKVQSGETSVMSAVDDLALPAVTVALGYVVTYFPRKLINRLAVYCFGITPCDFFLGVLKSSVALLVYAPVAYSKSFYAVAEAKVDLPLRRATASQQFINAMPLEKAVFFRRWLNAFARDADECCLRPFIASVEPFVEPFFRRFKQHVPPVIPQAAVSLQPLSAPSAQTSFELD